MLLVIKFVMLVSHGPLRTQSRSQGWVDLGVSVHFLFQRRKAITISTLIFLCLSLPLPLYVEFRGRQGGRDGWEFGVSTCKRLLEWIKNKVPLYYTVRGSAVSDSLGPYICSSRGSSAHRILQARILEWVAISFSRGSYRPRD